MKYKETIYEAWQFTQENKKMIIWYGLLPALLATLVGILYVTYQVLAFQASPLFSSNQDSFFNVLIKTIFNFIVNNFSLTVPLIIVGVVLVVVYFLVPILLQASMIDVIARKRHGQEINLGQGLNNGMLRFLPLFEYSLLMRTFSMITISAEAAFILRNLGPSLFQTMLPIIIIAAIVALILHILFTFAEYYIVIDEEGVMSAIIKSCTLVILNLQHTFMLVILMLIIGIRIIIQIALVIIIPAIFITGFAYFASISLPQYAIIFIGSVSALILLFASYLAAVVHVFAVAVWTFTFLNFTEEETITARHKF